ncbi:MAG: hypothetical protein ACP5MH_09250 [Thermoproteus sp.]
MEDVPEELKIALETFREARRPPIRIGYIRVKKVVGVIYGGEGEGKAEGGQ